MFLNTVILALLSPPSLPTPHPSPPNTQPPSRDRARHLRPLTPSPTPALCSYFRVIALVIALLEDNPGSPLAVRMLSLSLALDFIDGPLARRLGMCTQFGDLLDHVADHITMWWLVYITTSSTLNSLVNGLHCAVALLYMAKEGHYFKHSQGGNAVTKLIESNNYFNMPSLLWNANTWVIPLMKLSYALEHGEQGGGGWGLREGGGGGVLCGVWCCVLFCEFVVSAACE